MHLLAHWCQALLTTLLCSLAFAFVQAHAPAEHDLPDHDGIQLRGPSMHLNTSRSMTLPTKYISIYQTGDCETEKQSTARSTILTSFIRPSLSTTTICSDTSARSISTPCYFCYDFSHVGVHHPLRCAAEFGSRYLNQRVDVCVACGDINVERVFQLRLNSHESCTVCSDQLDTTVIVARFFDRSVAFGCHIYCSGRFCNRPPSSEVTASDVATASTNFTTSMDYTASTESTTSTGSIASSDLTSSVDLTASSGVIAPNDPTASNRPTASNTPDPIGTATFTNPATSNNPPASTGPSVPILAPIPVVPPVPGLPPVPIPPPVPVLIPVPIPPPADGPDAAPVPTPAPNDPEPIESDPESPDPCDMNVASGMCSNGNYPVFDAAAGTISYYGRYFAGRTDDPRAGWKLEGCEVEEYPFGSGNPDRSLSGDSVLPLIPGSRENSRHGNHMKRWINTVSTRWRDANNPAGNLRTNGLVYCVAFNDDFTQYLPEDQVDKNICSQPYGPSFGLVTEQRKTDASGNEYRAWDTCSPSPGTQEFVSGQWQLAEGFSPAPRAMNGNVLEAQCTDAGASRAVVKRHTSNATLDYGSVKKRDHARDLLSRQTSGGFLDANIYKYFGCGGDDSDDGDPYLGDFQSS
ncbi:uncharacterized protein MYCGRDRAFT_92805 [Zymoseptoria tritici IPO323]|uniref:Ca2+-modulated nonselective cation channel polycystin n=1 Tax=Zymoseptoria tritici (strain CBS 115943 / IPO323) TaxID=336722 RepID=F9XAD4_ZYMTI|nr:uncharacterized protein MYCGRDRAFT_92805 [Zymoseptoria tritici IPO323]EGP88095.1 hypothetical protein MYCGRDRAFT_92805 [Zymoseptoria tritici IPO323]